MKKKQLDPTIFFNLFSFLSSSLCIHVYLYRYQYIYYIQLNIEIYIYIYRVPRWWEFYLIGYDGYFSKLIFFFNLFRGNDPSIIVILTIYMMMMNTIYTCFSCKFAVIIVGVTYYDRYAHTVVNIHKKKILLKKLILNKNKKFQLWKKSQIK